MISLSERSPILDDLTIRQLRGLPDLEAAVAFDGCLRGLERQYRRSFVQRGLILLEVEERGLWRLLDDNETGLPYSSFEKWVVGAASHSRSDCFAALRAVKELRDVPVDQLIEMPRCNVSVMQCLSPAVRRHPEVVKAAQVLPAKEFVQRIGKDFPDQHIEERRTIHLAPVESAKAIIDEAIEMAMTLEEVKTREQALEAIAAEYIDTNRDRYDSVQRRSG